MPFLFHIFYHFPYVFHIFPYFAYFLIIFQFITAYTHLCIVIRYFELIIVFFLVLCKYSILSIYEQIFQKCETKYLRNACYPNILFVEFAHFQQYGSHAQKSIFTRERTVKYLILANDLANPTLFIQPVHYDFFL